LPGFVNIFHLSVKTGPGDVKSHPLAQLLRHVLEHLHRVLVFVERDVFVRRMVQRRITRTGERGLARLTRYRITSGR
jgi:hypothetical protein